MLILVLGRRALGVLGGLVGCLGRGRRKGVVPWACVSVEPAWDCASNLFLARMSYRAPEDGVLVVWGS